MLYGRSRAENGDGNGVMVTSSMQEEVGVCELTQSGARVDNHLDKDCLSRDEHMTNALATLLNNYQNKASYILHKQDSKEGENES